METLKLTSIRLERQSLEQANKIAKDYYYYSSSDVIRTALWAGLKIINTHNCQKLLHLKSIEDVGLKHYGLEDVLHAAAQNNEGAK